MVPRVMPTTVPLAYGSHHGDPRPVNAGTKNTPALSSTVAASGPVSAALPITPSPSRSHCTAEPVEKIAPSRAYAMEPSASVHATVVSIPSVGSGHVAPTLSSTKLPVPYVFLAMPGRTQACPNRAAC